MRVGCLEALEPHWKSSSNEACTLERPLPDGRGMVAGCSPDGQPMLPERFAASQMKRTRCLYAGWMSGSLRTALEKLQHRRSHARPTVAGWTRDGRCSPDGQ